jgi:hypothetical protein
MVPQASLSKALRTSSCLLKRTQNMIMRFWTLRRMPTLVRFILTFNCWHPLILSILTPGADVAAIAAAEFDDPNLDKSAALEGILGQRLSLNVCLAQLMLTATIYSIQRTTHHIRRLGRLWPTLMTLISPSPHCVHGSLVLFGLSLFLG